jgi:PI31 proteasome regulator N-terminal
VVAVVLFQIPTENVRKSDMLPAGWNNGGENYALVYQPADPSDSSTLMLKIVSFDGLMLTHLLVRFVRVNH